MSRFEPDLKERRNYRRLELNLPIAFEILGHETSDCSINFAKTKNVSTGGAYFESIADTDIEKDMKLKVVFDTLASVNGFDLNNVFKAPKLEAIAKVLRVNDVVEKDSVTEVMIRKQGVAVKFDKDLKILL